MGNVPFCVSLYNRRRKPWRKFHGYECLAAGVFGRNYKSGLVEDLSRRQGRNPDRAANRARILQRNRRRWTIVGLGTVILLELAVIGRVWQSDGTMDLPGVFTQTIQRLISIKSGVAEGREPSLPIRRERGIDLDWNQGVVRFWMTEEKDTIPD